MRGEAVKFDTSFFVHQQLSAFFKVKRKIAEDLLPLNIII